MPVQKITWAAVDAIRASQQHANPPSAVELAARHGVSVHTIIEILDGRVRRAPRRVAGCVRLSWEAAAYIRQRYALRALLPYSHAQLARELGVGTSAVYKVVRGINWRGGK